MRRQMELQHAAGASIGKSMRAIAEKLLMFLWGGSPAKYSPEAHYMRGRGPKWHEKYDSLQQASNLAKTQTAEKPNA
jgi:hypothetical protein